MSDDPLMKEAPGPVYLRIPRDGPVGMVGTVDTLVEVMPDGYVGRDIGLGADGQPVYVTRAVDSGRGPFEFNGPGPPGTPAFEEWWGDGTPITVEEFEAVYASAAATLPWTYGGVPRWISTVLNYGCLAILAALLIGVLAVILSPLHVI